MYRHRVIKSIYEYLAAVMLD